MPRSDTNHSRQRGVALLLMVMTCVLGSIIAASMLIHQRMDIEQAQRYFAFVQANQYAMGAELLARQMLYDDATDSDSDNLEEAWSTPVVKFQDDQLAIAMSIEDLQGRFNVNNLSKGDPNQTDMFKRLLSSLDITPLADISKIFPVPETHAAAGAPPVPGTPLVSVTPSQPKLLAEPTQLIDQLFSVTDYQKLAPFLCALPTGNTAINVNTTSDTLLKAAITAEAPLRTIQDRRTAKQPITAADLKQSGLSSSGAVDVQSGFFQVFITVAYQGKNYVWRSIMSRRKSKEGKLTVDTIARAFNREDNILP